MIKFNRCLTQTTKEFKFELKLNSTMLMKGNIYIAPNLIQSNCSSNCKFSLCVRVVGILLLFNVNVNVSKLFKNKNCWGT